MEPLNPCDSKKKKSLIKKTFYYSVSFGKLSRYKAHFSRYFLVWVKITLDRCINFFIFLHCQHRLTWVWFRCALFWPEWNVLRLGTFLGNAGVVAVASLLLAQTPKLVTNNGLCFKRTTQSATADWQTAGRIVLAVRITTPLSAHYGHCATCVWEIILRNIITLLQLSIVHSTWGWSWRQDAREREQVDVRNELLFECYMRISWSYCREDSKRAQVKALSK